MALNDFQERSLADVGTQPVLNRWKTLTKRFYTKLAQR